MKYILTLAMVLTFGLVGIVSADTYVRGYYKNNGTYVQPHYRSSPNSNRYDNWSSKGNVNPYTQKRGYKNPNRYQPRYRYQQKRYYP